MIILASASPRRRELLSLVVDEFIVVPSGADESTNIIDAPERVRHLAQRKARYIAKDYSDDIILGADTVVELNGEIFEKPQDTADAERMIRALSGNTHTVHTGICVIQGDTEIVQNCATRVAFALMTDEEINQYIQTENVTDKAGAYAIQSGAAKFITGIDGDFFNVVGLPVQMLYQILLQLPK